ncbi:MAG: SPOR domain-containing protein [Steroidobacteraceae bacterium]
MILLRPVGLIGLLGIALFLGTCSSERRDWRSAQAADTIESYGRFLGEHPEGELAADARARIEQLAEERDWKRAMELDTANAYERFLSQHSSGRWAQEARIRAESFVLSEDGAGSAQPPSSAAPDATRRDGFNVQLGAFGTEDGARAEWQRLVGRFSAELRGLSADISAADTSAGSLYRLQVGVADEAAARTLCAALARQKQACVVVLPRTQ